MLEKITILSLFPESIENYLNSSIIKRAREKKQIQIEIINFRDYTTNKHKKVDDTVYGGGVGMVIGIQPIVDCLKQIKTEDSFVILTTPSGYLYKQETAKKIATSHKHVIIICGHYEGIDERIYEYIDMPISIGDYILTGGELAACIIVDSTTRLIDGVINKDSLVSESFEDMLLDHPVYTKPKEFENQKVPDVLLSGNHKLINEFNLEQRIAKTKKYRPDIYKAYTLKKGK